MSSFRGGGSPERFQRARAEAGGVRERERESERKRDEPEVENEYESGLDGEGRKKQETGGVEQNLALPSSGVAASVKMTFWG